MHEAGKPAPGGSSTKGGNGGTTKPTGKPQTPKPH